MSPWATVLAIANALLGQPAGATPQGTAVQGTAVHGAAAPRARTEFPLYVVGPEKCVVPAELARELERKLSGYRFPVSNRADAALWIRFTPVAGELEVDVRFEKSSDDVFTRRLTAHDCEEARLAASFVVSVALEGPESAQTTPGGAVDNGPGGGKASNASPLIAETPTAGRTRKRPSRPPAALDAWLNARMTVLGGPAPTPLWGGAVSVGVGRARPGVWSPAFELELGYSATFPTEQALGTASFDLGSVGLFACPSLAVLGPIQFRPCVFGHFGFLRAVGSNTFAPAVSMRPWVDVGLRLTALLPLGRRFGLVAGVDASYPFIQDSFLFDSQAIHTVLPVSVGGTLGVVIHFR